MGDSSLLLFSPRCFYPKKREKKQPRATCVSKPIDLIVMKPATIVWDPRHGLARLVFRHRIRTLTFIEILGMSENVEKLKSVY